MFKKIVSFLGKPHLTAFLLATIFIFIYSKHSLYRHESFNSHAFDLGIYTQATYLYSKGLVAFSTLKHMPIIADHFGPILILLSPIYRVFPDASTLLIIQALAVGLSSIPIYAIALDKLKHKALSLLITLSYLSSAGLISAINFDFHLATISTLPLSLILYSWYFKKWRMYWSLLFLSILFKEDIPLFLLGIGGFALFQKQKLIGVATIIFSTLSFYLIKFQLMPFFFSGSENSYLATSSLPLTSPLDMLFLMLTRPLVYLDTVFNSPIKIGLLNTLLKEFSFLSILSPLSWLTVFPSLFLRFSSSYTQMWTNDFHHNANLMPFLAVSAILAIDRFSIPTKAVILLLTFFLVTGGLSPRGFVLNAAFSTAQPTSRAESTKRIIKQLPSTAAISAQSPLVPHLSNREKIYLFPEISDADYIVLDKTLSSYPLNNEQFKKEISQITKSKLWTKVSESETLLIFKRLGT